MLDRRPDSKPVTNAYTRRLQLYRGEIGPDAVVSPADTDEVQIATLAYGLGNWYLVRGDKAQARKWFERSIQASGGWPGFGSSCPRRSSGGFARSPSSIVSRLQSTAIGPVSGTSVPSGTSPLPKPLPTREALCDASSDDVGRVFKASSGHRSHLVAVRVAPAARARPVSDVAALAIGTPAPT